MRVPLAPQISSTKRLTPMMFGEFVLISPLHILHTLHLTLMAVVAAEKGPSATSVVPSGSSSTLMTDAIIKHRSAEEQLARVAIGVFTRSPEVQLGQGKVLDYNDIQMEIVCVKAQNGGGNTPSSSTQGTPSGTSPTAASKMSNFSSHC
jgi:hypothetical protein